MTTNVRIKVLTTNFDRNNAGTEFAIGIEASQIGKVTMITKYHYEARIGDVTATAPKPSSAAMLAWARYMQGSRKFGFVA